MQIRLIAAALFLLPAPAIASCEPGGTPSYRDITYVDVRQYSLVGILHPSFEFEGTNIPRPSSKSSPVASLNARRAVPFHGNFVAVDPLRAFNDVVAVVERNRLLDMHMTAPYCCYLDGPEDVVTVVRCGVKTTIGTISEGGQVKLDDAQGKAFFRLEDELRKTVFAEKWMMPTPTPQ